ncbi:hypothetical protein LPJ72_000619 [Coemansia sp. Benny D160-2]|nr:hypothetical protein LPJ72_000619 [Coemansia sp. Benny D160-2]
MPPRNSRPPKRQRAQPVGREQERGQEHRNNRRRGKSGTRYRVNAGTAHCSAGSNLQTDSAGSSTTDAGSAAPRSLPGFVWDEEKQRYFPAASGAADCKETQYKERERARMRMISEAQKRERERRCQQQQHQKQQQQQRQQHQRRVLQNEDWTVPMALRRLTTYPATTRVASLGQTRRADISRLRFAWVGESRRSIEVANQLSAVTALRVFPATGEDGGSCAGRIVAVGRRSGEINVVEIDDDHNVTERFGFGVQGEVVCIEHIADDRFVYAYMGSVDGGGVAITGAGTGQLCTYEFPRQTVFCATRPPAALGAASRVATAAGLECHAAILAVVPTGLQKVFNAKTGSDILSTAFLSESPDVFVGGGRDGCIRLFDRRVDSKRHNQRRGLLSPRCDGCRHKSSVHGVGSDGWLVVSASMDGESRVWDFRMPMGSSSYFSVGDPPIDTHGPEAAMLGSLQSSASGMPASRRLGFDVRNGVAAIADSDNHVRIWDVRSAERLQALPFPVANGSCGAVCLDWEPSALHPSVFVGQLNEVVVCSSEANL